MIRLIKNFKFFISLIVFLGFYTIPCFSQDSLQSAIPRAKWIRDRGPFDPRPYESTVFKSPLINANYFNTKNKLWVEKGFSFGGYASANVQWGSKGGPAHGICESLNNGAWEPLRKTNTAGHGYLVHKKKVLRHYLVKDQMFDPNRLLEERILTKEFEKIKT